MLLVAALGGGGLLPAVLLAVFGGGFAGGWRGGGVGGGVGGDLALKVFCGGDGDGDGGGERVAALPGGAVLTAGPPAAAVDLLGGGEGFAGGVFIGGACLLGGGGALMVPAVDTLLRGGGLLPEPEAPTISLASSPGGGGGGAAGTSAWHEWMVGWLGGRLGQVGIMWCWHWAKLGSIEQSVCFMLVSSSIGASAGSDVVLQHVWAMQCGRCSVAWGRHLGPGVVGAEMGWVVVASARVVAAQGGMVMEEGGWVVALVVARAVGGVGWVAAAASEVARLAALAALARLVAAGPGREAEAAAAVMVERRAWLRAQQSTHHVNHCRLMQHFDQLCMSCSWHRSE